MTICRIEPGRNKRYKIYGDGEYLFSLYKSELRTYRIKEDTDISEDIIREIYEKVIYKRAKERALYLVEKRILSTRMLRDKLHENEYSESIINRVVVFLEEYGYLNDTEFVHMYVNTYSRKKSRKQLRYGLIQKGISKELIDDFFENNDYAEEDCFNMQFECYIKNKNLSDPLIRQKVFRYFYGKGFTSAMICSQLKEQE